MLVDFSDALYQGGPEVDEAHEDDEEYNDPPAPTPTAKRAREEEEEAQAAGDEKEGYVTDVNTDTDGTKAKKVKTD
jgi:hypothetical protein